VVPPPSFTKNSSDRKFSGVIPRMTASTVNCLSLRTACKVAFSASSAEVSDNAVFHSLVADSTTMVRMRFPVALLSVIIACGSAQGQWTIQQSHTTASLRAALYFGVDYFYPDLFQNLLNKVGSQSPTNTCTAHQ
jgi:hypothetical protein